MAEATDPPEYESPPSFNGSRLLFASATVHAVAGATLLGLAILFECLQIWHVILGIILLGFAAFFFWASRKLAQQQAAATRKKPVPKQSQDSYEA